MIEYHLTIEAAMAASDDVGKRKEIERVREVDRRLEIMFLPDRYSDPENLVGETLFWSPDRGYYVT